MAIMKINSYRQAYSHCVFSFTIKINREKGCTYGTIVLENSKI